MTSVQALREYRRAKRYQAQCLVLLQMQAREEQLALTALVSLSNWRVGQIMGAAEAPSDALPSSFDFLADFHARQVRRVNRVLLVALIWCQILARLDRWMQMSQGGTAMRRRFKREVKRARRYMAAEARAS